MLFPNAKTMNLKVSLSLISDIWKRFHMSFSHEFIRKKAKPLMESVLEFWSYEALCSKKDSSFCISVFKKTVLTICK